MTPPVKGQDVEQLALFTEDARLTKLYREQRDLTQTVQRLGMKIDSLIRQGKETPGRLCNEYGESAQQLKDCQRDIKAREGRG